MLEDPRENDVGSFSLKQNAFNYQNRLHEVNKHKEQIRAKIEVSGCDKNSLQDVEEDQDELLLESTFSQQRDAGESFKRDDEDQPGSLKNMF